MSHPNRRDSKNGTRYCDFFSVWSMTFRCFASGEYKVRIAVCSIFFFLNDYFWFVRMEINIRLGLGEREGRRKRKRNRDGIA